MNSKEIEALNFKLLGAWGALPKESKLRLLVGKIVEMEIEVERYCNQ